MRVKLVRRIAIGGFVLGVLAYLFLTSLRSSNAEPYSVNAAELSGWTLTMEEPGQPALVALRPPGQLRHAIYQQVFQRLMVSLMQPDLPMPIVLQREYEAGLRASLKPEEILTAARDAGLEHIAFKPVCLGQDQDSAPGRSRQFYYAVFESAAYDSFRAGLAGRLAQHGGAGAFDPKGLRPILPIAASDPQFAAALRENGAEPTCVAPLVSRES